MQIEAYQGKYIVAVSGGVDSMVLLDLLVGQAKTNPKLKLVVANFNHGIRSDGHLDIELVAKVTKHYDLDLYGASGNLGASASEEQARDARYSFLRYIKEQTNSDGIMTAHHQDDVIETALINLLRGSGRKGLSSLKSTAEIKRPLLNFSKAEIIGYAKTHGIKWREDSTNNDVKYLRNYLRLKIVPNLSPDGKKQLLELISRQAALNLKIDKQLDNIFKDNLKKNDLPRLWLNSLDNQLSRELIAAWLRQNGLSDFDRKLIERLSTNLKVLKAGKKTDVIHGWQVRVNGADLALEHVER